MIEYYKSQDYLAEDGFPIAIWSIEEHDATSAHSHQFDELVVITGGSGLHLINQEQYPVTAGDVFVIKPNCWHEYRNPKQLSLVNILYDSNSLKMDKWDIHSLPGHHAMFHLEPAFRKHHKFESHLRLTREELTTVKQLIESLHEELLTRDPGFRLMATAIFMQIVTFLSRCYSESPPQSSKALLRIAEAISYIEDNFESNINIDALSEIAHMSRRNFQRVFRQTMNLSPIDYLIRIRTARAAELLKTSSVAVTEIAFLVGFQDSNYFSRQFKKIMGLSPRQYRNISRTG